MTVEGVSSGRVRAAGVVAIAEAPLLQGTLFLGWNLAGHQEMGTRGSGMESVVGAAISLWLSAQDTGFRERWIGGLGLSKSSLRFFL